MLQRFTDRVSRNTEATPHFRTQADDNGIRAAGGGEEMGFSPIRDERGLQKRRSIDGTVC